MCHKTLPLCILFELLAISAGQTWHTQMSSEGALGVSYGGPDLQKLQFLP